MVNLGAAFSYTPVIFVAARELLSSGTWATGSFSPHERGDQQCKIVGTCLIIWIVFGWTREKMI